MRVQMRSHDIIKSPTSLEVATGIIESLKSSISESKCYNESNALNKLNTKVKRAFDSIKEND